jgi:hypothetical protein
MGRETSLFVGMIILPRHNESRSFPGAHAVAQPVKIEEMPFKIKLELSSRNAFVTFYISASAVV